MGVSDHRQQWLELLDHGKRCCAYNVSNSHAVLIAVHRLKWHTGRHIDGEDLSKGRPLREPRWPSNLELPFKVEKRRRLTVFADERSQLTVFVQEIELKPVTLVRLMPVCLEQDRHGVLRKRSGNGAPSKTDRVELSTVVRLRVVGEENLNVHVRAKRGFVDR